MATDRIQFFLNTACHSRVHCYQSLHKCAFIYYFARSTSFHHCCIWICISSYVFNFVCTIHVCFPIACRSLLFRIYFSTRFELMNINWNNCKHFFLFAYFQNGFWHQATTIMILQSIHCILCCAGKFKKKTISTWLKWKRDKMARNQHWMLFFLILCAIENYILYLWFE